MTTAVVHLIWRPLGLEPWRRFLASYRAHDAGLAHDLVLLFNGFGSEADCLPWLELADVLPHQVILTPRPMLDLVAYHHVATQLPHHHICFLNSYTRVLVDGWLARLTRALQSPGVGLAGTTGSCESVYTGELIFNTAAAPEHLETLRQAFPPFPNPHVRTTGFLMERHRWLSFDTGRIQDKAQAYRMESGYESLTRWIASQGLQAVLAGADGRTFEAAAWGDSGTFAQANQENLLVADNRTDDYAAMSPLQRLRRREVTWGTITGFQEASTARQFLHLLDQLQATPERWFPLQWRGQNRYAEAFVSWGLPVRVDTTGPSAGAVAVIRPGEGDFELSVYVTEGTEASPVPVDETWRVSADGLQRSGRTARVVAPCAEVAIASAAWELHLERVEAWYRKARRLRRKRAQWMRYVERLVAACPGMVQTHLLAGRLAMDAGRDDEAAHHFGEALRLDRGYSDGLLSMAQVHLRRDDPKAAQAVLSELLRERPLHWQGRLLRLRTRVS